MSDYVIFTDSSCDLPASLAKELGLYVMPLSVHMNGKEYRNLLDESELTSKQFYADLRNGVMATTSAANVESIQSEMRRILESGRDILNIAFSSALSATYQNGCIAAKELAEQFPRRKIYCVDSKCASLGQGMLICLAAQKKREGASLEELRDYVEKTLPHQCHWFTVDDLHFLKRGGRVSAATAVLGTMLQIKPVLHVDDMGRLINVSKAKGRKASIKALFDKAVETAVDIGKQTVFISHGDCLEDAEYLAGMLRDKLHPVDVIINPVGPVIGAHSGPGTLALFFLGTKR